LRSPKLARDVAESKVKVKACAETKKGAPA